MRLEGKAAIVTGAASGIGRATAGLFAEQGADVLAVDLPGKGLAEAHAGPERIHCLEKSIADGDAAETIVGAALDRFGRLDILFNNAGVGTNALAEAMTDEQWDVTLDVNLKAPYRLCRAAIPHLRQSGAGRIINTASVMARMTDYGLTAYCASKAGVAGMTRTLALELGKYAITANYIEPGAIQTGIARHRPSSLSCQRRPDKPEEVLVRDLPLSTSRRRRYDIRASPACPKHIRRLQILCSWIRSPVRRYCLPEAGRVETVERNFYDRSCGRAYTDRPTCRHFEQGFRLPQWPEGSPRPLRNRFLMAGLRDGF